MTCRSVATAVLIGTGLLSIGAQREVIAQEPHSLSAEPSATALALRDSVVALARAQIGSQYVFGGEDPERGFDCSGLIRYVLAALNLSTPRTASQQATLGAAVVKDQSRLRPGDLLTFSGDRGVISHIGIYVGNGRYVHASSRAGRVIESPINRPATTLVTVWQGARRLLAFMDPGEDGWKLPSQRLATRSPPKEQPLASPVVARSPHPHAALAALSSTTIRLSPADALKPKPVTFVAAPTPAPAVGSRPALDLGRFIALAAPELPWVTPTLRLPESQVGLASLQ